MSESKRRASQALPFKECESTASANSLKKPAKPMDKKRSAVDIRAVKIQSEQIREKLQKSIMDNPLAAKKAAFVIGLWLEGKTKVKKKAG